MAAISCTHLANGTLTASTVQVINFASWAPYVNVTVGGTGTIYATADGVTVPVASAANDQVLCANAATTVLANRNANPNTVQSVQGGGATGAVAGLQAFSGGGTTQVQLISSGTPTFTVSVSFLSNAAF